MLTRWLLLLVVLVFLSPRTLAETKVNAYFRPGQEIRDITGVRYKCRLIENESPEIVILFGYHRTCGPSTAGPSGGTYMLESNLYANGLRFKDGTITTDKSIQGAYVPVEASLRMAVSEYFQPIHCWTKTSSAELFPRQTYLIDGIGKLWKTDMVSQTNLNDVEFSVEIVRDDILRDLTGWQSAEPRDTSTAFRGWHATVQLKGKTYVTSFTLPEINGRYLACWEFLEFESEFLWRTKHFRAELWGFQMKREQDRAWRPVNQWKVTRQDDPPTKYGARVLRRGNTPVIEISNVGRPDYMPLNTEFDLGVGNGPGSSGTGTPAR